MDGSCTRAPVAPLQHRWGAPRRRITATFAVLLVFGATAACSDGQNESDGARAQEPERTRLALPSGPPGAAGWFVWIPDDDEAPPLLVDLAADDATRPFGTTIALTNPGDPLFPGSPASVPHPELPLVLYTSSTSATPEQRTPHRIAMQTSVRMVDVETGEDALLVDGARGVAIGADGRFATVLGVDPLVSGSDGHDALEHPGHIVVHDAVGDPGEAWTVDSWDYTVLGWAERTLVAARAGHGGVPGATVLLRGPGDLDVLEGLTPLAIAPDGSAILVATGAAASVHHDPEEPDLGLLDLETGTITAWGPHDLWGGHVAWVDGTLVMARVVGSPEPPSGYHGPEAGPVLAAADASDEARGMAHFHHPPDLDVDWATDAFVLDADWVAAIATPNVDARREWSSRHLAQQLVRCPRHGHGDCEAIELDTSFRSRWQRVANPSRPLPAASADRWGVAAR